jgi:hypothetical protein
MLTYARRKIAGSALSVDFRWQDMRALNIAAPPFDAVFCLFDSIGYIESNEELINVLRGVNSHMRAGGLFLFEFWHAAATVRSYDPVRVLRRSVPSGEVIRISETRLEIPKQLARVTYSIHELNHDGRYRSLKETQTNRYFSIQEMETWLSSCGFIPLKWFAGYTPDEHIDENTWHVVAVARKGGENA